MTYDDAVRCRVRSSVAGDIEDLAERAGLSESEVIRRLLRLGLQDIEQIGDEALLAAAPDKSDTTPSENCVES